MLSEEPVPNRDLTIFANGCRIVLTEAGDIEFHTLSSIGLMLRSDGRILVNGREAATDLEVVDRFRDFVHQFS